MEKTKTTAIVVAAGSGVRMKSPVRKQYLLLNSRPILVHALCVLETCPLVDEIVLVVPEKDFSYCRENILVRLAYPDRIRLTAGGERRQDSVYNGLRAIDPRVENDLVAIHDGARPLISSDDVISCIETARRTGAAILAMPASDTVKMVDRDFRITRTLSRDQIWLAQTPQVFRYGLIMKAHRMARAQNFKGTDDASLVERLGKTVSVVRGSSYNIKVTTPEDLALAEVIMQS